MLDPDLGPSRPLVPPLYPAAVYTLPDLDALDAIMEGREAGFIYARDGHPNSADLAARLARLEAPNEPTAWGVVTGSGMGAIAATLLSLLQTGDRIVASDKLYGRTAQLFQQEFGRFHLALQSRSRQRRVAIPGLGAEIGTLVQQRLRHGYAPLPGGPHQGGAPVFIGRIRIHPGSKK